MGCYIEVEDKENWLLENSDDMFLSRYGEGLDEFPPYESFKNGSLPVVLVDNGLFKAAGIAYDKKEYEMFTRHDDTRPREVFSVPLKKLLNVSDLERWIAKGH